MRPAGGKKKLRLSRGCDRVKQVNLRETLQALREENVMCRQWNMVTLVALAVTLLITPVSQAATVRAASCSQADVAKAVFSAGTGDLVIVPAGSCTWTQTVSISTRITLQGAGTDLTTITGSPAGMMAIDGGQSGSRIMGFTFNKSYITVDGDGWRVDHCKFVGDGIYVVGQREAQHPSGVIDHCTLIDGRILVIGWAGLMAHALWAQPLDLGGVAGVVYVEDCSFTGINMPNAMDTNYGGRYVFRYNKLTDAYVEAHSLQGNHRASRRWEIYNNTFNQVNNPMWVPMFLRGGTGVVFNNVLTGSWTRPGIALDNVRSCDSRAGSGKCDGSSPWDGNQPGGNGYPCRDQIGRSMDSRLWTLFSPYPPQASDPAFAWNNKHGANDVVFFQHDNCPQSPAHIQPGRDYYSNTQKQGYKPAAYPHPLVQGWSPERVAAPENLHVVERSTE